MRVIDLTQTIVNNMQVYPGDAPPNLHQTHTTPKDGYSNYQLTIGMHTGTHIDGPMHMLDTTRFVADFPLDNFIGKACIIDISKEKVFSNVPLIKEKSKGCTILLFYTGFGQFFGTDKYLSDYPIVTNEVAEAITESNIKLVALDSLSPDIAPYNVHRTLLRKNVFLAENLTNLHLLLQQRNIEIIALPLNIVADSAPARIVAVIK